MSPLEIRTLVDRARRHIESLPPWKQACLSAALNPKPHGPRRNPVGTTEEHGDEVVAACPGR